MWNFNLLLTSLLYLSDTALYLIAGADIYGLKGGTVVFVCPFKSNIELRWSILESSTTVILTINNNINPALEPGLRTKLSVVGNQAIGEYNLQISDIRESDEGKYRCSVGTQQDVQTLYLIMPPTSVNLENVTPQDKLLCTEGQDLTVSCVAEGGKPPPNVTLKIDGKIQATGIQNIYYTVKSISRSYDKKIGMCQASNEANGDNPMSDSAMFYLNLRPLQPILSSDLVSTEESRPLVVSCTSSGSRPQATFKWMIGQATITSGITTTSVYNTADDTYTVSSTLTYSVDRTYNGQTLTCGAYNNVSTNGVVASTTLDVKYAPDITVANVTYNQIDNIRTIICIPIGNPTAYTYYRWQHKSMYGVLIRELDGEKNLTLPSVPIETRYQDSGEYVCTASNGVTDRDGKIQQTGSGYAAVNAEPKFTRDNKNTFYGELRKDMDIPVYVYSVPKFTSVQWYKRTSRLSMSTNKYTINDAAAMVTDSFFVKEVKLDGYRLSLTIKNLDQSDFNVTYRIEVSNGIGQSVGYNISLQSASPPETPVNFTILSSAESSIVVQWEPGYNGGHEQTFYVQYRVNGFNPFESVEIYDKKQSERQTFTLSGLQDDTTYEIRMYSGNKFNKSLPTETVLIKTVKGNKVSSTEAVIGGVAGGLSAVIVILVFIIIVLVLRKQGTRKQRLNAETSRSAEAYETLGIKDNPSTYTELSIRQWCGAEYETLDMPDKLNSYSELHGQQERSNIMSHKSTVYENMKVQQGPSHSEYTNIKI